MKIKTIACFSFTTQVQCQLLEYQETKMQKRKMKAVVAVTQMMMKIYSWSLMIHRMIWQIQRMIMRWQATQLLAVN